MKLKNKKLKPVLKNKKLNAMIQAALKYAKKGWPVLPVYGVDEHGNCACGKSDCEHQGKHPMTMHGIKDATTDVNIIKDHWKTYPDSNIGIATGKDSVIVLDVDGKEGRKSLAALEKQYGKLPDTVTVITGNGKHYWFKSSVVVKNSTSKVGEKIDVRGNGGYIIAPPSNHYSGQTYHFQEGSGLDDVEMADISDWLLGLMLADNKKISLNTGNPKNLPVKLTNSGFIPDGERNDTLFRFGCYLRSKGHDYEAIYSQLIKMNIEQCQPPLDSSEIDTIINSCMRYSPDGDLQKSLQYTTDWLTANSNVNFDKILSDNNLLKSLAIISKEDAQHFAQIIMLLKKKIF